MLRTPAFCLRSIYDRTVVSARQLSSSKVVLARGMSTPKPANVRVVDGEETMEEVRKDLATLLKEEIEEKTTAGILEDHSEEFLSLANGVAEETESEVRVTWQTTPYSVEVVFEKPTGGIDVDGEGLGADIVHELNEEQMRALEQAEKSAPPVHQGKLLPAQDGDQDANDEDDEDDEDDEEDSSSSSSSDEDEDEQEDEQVLFEVKLKKEGSDKSIGLWCMAGLDNRLYVEQVFVDSAPPLNFASLSEPVQDRMYDFLDSIHVDDRLGFYMRRRFYKSKREGGRAILTAMAELVELDKETAKKEKKGNKKNQQKK